MLGILYQLFYFLMFFKIKICLQKEASIKTPDEMSMQLGDHAEENFYPEQINCPALYINDSSAKQVDIFGKGEDTIKIPIFTECDGYILDQKMMRMEIQ